MGEIKVRLFTDMGCPLILRILSDHVLLGYTYDGQPPLKILSIETPSLLLPHQIQGKTLPLLVPVCFVILW